MRSLLASIFAVVFVLGILPGTARTAHAAHAPALEAGPDDAIVKAEVEPEPRLDMDTSGWWDRGMLTSPSPRPQSRARRRPEPSPTPTLTPTCGPQTAGADRGAPVPRRITARAPRRTRSVGSRTRTIEPPGRRHPGRIGWRRAVVLPAHDLEVAPCSA